jgi:hypothetical protein
MSLLGLLPGATDHLPVLATVKDAARRYAAALRTVLDRACAPARLAATGGTEHTGHTRREIKPILAETESLQNPGRSRGPRNPRTFAPTRPGFRGLG